MTDHALLVICQQDPDLWFSNLPSDRTVARELCEECPLQETCIRVALDIEGGAAVQHRHGIWGGLDPVQRRRLAEETGLTHTPEGEAA
ncbi:MAG: WhiB family transcriptional regulator [Micrococcus sp.]|nr:WhiB family transcriptional regulator [Micrococcus sp.]